MELLKTPAAVCELRPELTARKLLTASQAAQLGTFFKVMGNGARLRMLHALVKSGELCLRDLANTVGMTSQAVSNQMQRLLDRGVVVSERRGVNVFYRIVDPCVVSIIEEGLCLAGASRTWRR